MLWIDDETGPNDPAVILLGLEGIGVDCAGSGEQGIATALSGTHDGIVLDRCLPDIDGLAVLERLVVARCSAPAMMLTGFADVQGAVAALRFGAFDFRQKPLLGEELVSAVRALCAHGLPAGRASAKPKAKLTPMGAAAQALTDQHLSAMEFLILLHAFRRSRFQDSKSGPVFLSKRATTALCASQVDALAAGLEQLAEHARIGELMCTDEFARAVNLPREEVRALLVRIVGLSFLQCRLALRIRPTLPLLVFTLEQSAQIAFSAHYEWAAQFDRDFRAVLGLTPIAFRDACGGVRTRTLSNSDHPLSTNGSASCLVPKFAEAQNLAMGGCP